MLSFVGMDDGPRMSKTPNFGTRTVRDLDGSTVGPLKNARLDPNLDDHAEASLSLCRSILYSWIISKHLWASWIWYSSKASLFEARLVLIFPFMKAADQNWSEMQFLITMNIGFRTANIRYRAMSRSAPGFQKVAIESSIRTEDWAYLLVEARTFPWHRRSAWSCAIISNNIVTWGKHLNHSTHPERQVLAVFKWLHDDIYPISRTPQQWQSYHLALLPLILLIICWLALGPSRCRSLCRLLCSLRFVYFLSDTERVWISPQTLPQTHEYWSSFYIYLLEFDPLDAIITVVNSLGF